MIPVHDQNGAVPAAVALAPVPATATPPLLIHFSLYTRRSLALTRKTRGSSASDLLHDTPSIDDMDGEFVLAQQWECTSEHTLADLADHLVCRNREIPESTAPSTTFPGAYHGHWAASPPHQPEYPTYTGARLDTDTCMLVEGRLYGRKDCTDDASYVRALLDAESLGDAVYGGQMHTTRFAELLTVAFRQPYWMLHCGDCEHVWVMEYARYVALLM